MPITVLLGVQWGDEGKGRITDALAAEADIVARYNGGDNAGHSITVGQSVVRLHLVPSGIFHARCLNIIGNGTVVNPVNLLKEIAEIRAAGIEVSPARLRISRAAHVILPDTSRSTRHARRKAASAPPNAASDLHTAIKLRGSASVLVRWMIRKRLRRWCAHTQSV